MNGDDCHSLCSMFPYSLFLLAQYIIYREYNPKIKINERWNYYDNRNKRYEEAFNKIAPHMPKKGERLNDRGKTLLEEMERFTRESNELLMQLIEEIKAGS